jgi:uncharacterized protein YneR
VRALRKSRREAKDTISFAPNTFSLTYSVRKKELSFSMDVIDHVKEKQRQEDIALSDEESDMCYFEGEDLEAARAAQKRLREIMRSIIQ